MPEPQKYPMISFNTSPRGAIEEFYNHAHDKNGKFTSGKDTGKGGAPLPVKGKYGEGEGIGWSLAQGQDLWDKWDGAGEGPKAPRWEPENQRQADALNRLASVPTAGDQSPPGKKSNKDWIRTQGEVDTRGKSVFDENKAKALIDQNPGAYTQTIDPSSIVPSEHYVKRNSVAETIHQTDNPTGPYARPGYLPIVVPNDKGPGYLLINGNHRVEAAHYLQEPSINVDVMNPNEDIFK